MSQIGRRAPRRAMFLLTICVSLYEQYNEIVGGRGFSKGKGRHEVRDVILSNGQDLFSNSRKTVEIVFEFHVIPAAAIICLNPLRTSADNIELASRSIDLNTTHPRLVYPIQCIIYIRNMVSHVRTKRAYSPKCAMVSHHVRTKRAYSPKPHKYKVFEVDCYHRCFRTTVTAHPGVVRDWIFKMRRRRSYQLRRRELIVGLGVQWSAFSNNPAATLQLSVGRECLIFQLSRAPRAPMFLRRLLEDPEITRVGVNNHRDVAMLETTKHGLCVGGVLDLARVARYQGISTSPHLSMEVLAEDILGMQGVKKAEDVGRSNWDAFTLSGDQVEYACLDASLSFLMAKALEAWQWTP
nr:Werner Syndrome-like exonuclease [Ipomoea batatas]